MSPEPRILSRWKSASRPFQVLTVILIVAGFAVATGAILGSIQKTQKVTGALLFLDANCSGTDDGNEVFPDVTLGMKTAFCLGVTNVADTDLTAHTHLNTTCPAGGNATLSDGPGLGDDLQGPDGQAACSVMAAGTPKTMAAGATAIWSFNVTYSSAIGDYRWTFSAAQG